MGGGTYSSTVLDNGMVSNASRGTMGQAAFFTTASAGEMFKQKQINNAMNPYGIKIRESRDSKEHPESFAIVLALDVTGSMGSIPHWLAKEGLPSIMKKIIDGGEKDPQILFLGVGDHEVDNAPLQVGQFESSDELLDKWLTDIFMEGGGGGNNGESYPLAWYFAANHTSIDCFEKRKRKGLLITVGDEPFLKNIPARAIKSLMGVDQSQDYSAADLLTKARQTYDVRHVHVKETASGQKQDVIDGWKQALGDSLLIADKKEAIQDLIVSCVIHKIKRQESPVEDDDLML